MLLEINTVNFLYKISKKINKNIRKGQLILKLGQVPIEEWQKLSYDSSVKYIWLMGVWKRSKLSKKIAIKNINQYLGLLPEVKEEYILGSAYSIVDYIPDPIIGDFEDLIKVKKILNKLGIGLILDFVPNHFALDNVYISKRIFVETNFEGYLRNPGLFYILAQDKKMRYIAFGRDPFFGPWTDTLQINIFSKEARKILTQNLKKISNYCDGVRVDMAMLLLKDIFYNNWKEYLTYKEVEEEFWNTVTSKFNIKFIAESYWGTENRLLNLGFDYAYDKRFLDSLINHNLQEIKYLISLNPSFQKRLVRFLENHDEQRIANQLNDYNTLPILTLFFTSLGLKMVYNEQFEGQLVRIPVQLLASKDYYKSIPLYEKFIKIYKTIFDFLQEGKFFVYKIKRIYDDSYNNLLAYGYRLGDKVLIVAINFTAHYSQAILSINEVYPKNVFEDFQKEKKEVILVELIKKERYRRDLENLHVILNPFEAQIFLREGYEEK